MADTVTKRDWDYIWTRLSNYALNSNLPIESPFLGVRPYLDSPMTVYVGVDGNDVNAGTADQPLKTITRALEFARTWTINNKFTIQVGPGTFDGFWIPDDVLFGTSNLAQLVIQGSTTVLASGLISTTSSLPGTIIDTTADFSTIPIGSMARFSSTATFPTIPVANAPVYEVLDANTLRTTYGTTSGAGFQYEVVSLDTTILVNAGNNRLGGANVVAIGCNSKIGAQSNRTTANPLVCAQQLKSATSASSSRILLTNSDTFGLIGCDFSVGGSASACNVSGILGVTGGIFRLSGSGRAMFVPPAGQKITMQTANSLFYGVGSATATAFQCSNINSEFNIRIVSSISIGVSTVFSNAGSLGSQPGIITANGNFTGATNVFNVSGPLAQVQLLVSSVDYPFTSPAANAIFLVLSKGASAQLGAGFRMQGGAPTTEINLDGTTTTMAAVRALTPRAFPASPNAYGTVVFE